MPAWCDSTVQTPSNRNTPADDAVLAGAAEFARGFSFVVRSFDGYGQESYDGCDHPDESAFIRR
jgi:hypothetical protein